MFKLFKKYYSIDKTERKILNRTFFWLIYAFILVRIIPLKWFSHLLGEFKKETKSDFNYDQIKTIDKLKKSIRRIKKQLPWEVKCFEEAIAAKKILEKYKITTTIYLGVAKKTENNLHAHAWLKNGSYFIVGEKGYCHYSVVGFYT
ncbi:lasso peptide biosynthesis B2 protein [Bacteroidota bacterium]